MVLVEYPLDSAGAEAEAAQTLDWLEQHLREQFNTAGLPEEMADVSEDDDEISVQLYLKHLSESKPFRMRSFTWKVADSFDDLFGEPDMVGIEDLTERDIVAEAAQAKRKAEMVATVDETVGEADTSSTADSFLLAEPESLVLLPEGEEDLILSELEEDHLNLEIESDADAALDLDEELGKALESGAASIPDLSASSEADLDAALSEGVDLSQIVIPSTPAEFTLPGEAIEVNSSDFDLPTVDLPDSIAPQTASISSDFFTFGEGVAKAETTERSPSTDLDFSSVFVGTNESDDLAVANGFSSTDLFDLDSSTEEVLTEAQSEEIEPEDHETEEPELEEPEPENHETEATVLPAEAVDVEPDFVDDLLLEDEAAIAQPTVEPIVEPTIEPDIDEPDIEPLTTVVGEYDLVDEVLGDTTLEDAEIDEALLEDADLPLTAEEAETEIESVLVEVTEDASEDTPAERADSDASADAFSLESDSFEVSAEAEPVPDGFVEEMATDSEDSEEPDLDLASSEEPHSEETPQEDDLELADALDMSAIAAGYGLSSLNEDGLDDEVSFQDGAFESEHDRNAIQNELTLDDDVANEEESDYYLDGEEDNQPGDALDDYEYESEDYDSEEYRDDPNYYLEGEREYEELYEGDDVALIDEGEVQRQREQWQQQSKNTPWMLFGTLGLLVVGTLGYIISRPCVFTQCERIQTAQIKGDEAIGNLRADASLDDVKESQGELRHAIRMLQPIPVWSRYHGQVEEILPEYEYQIESLDLVGVAQEKAYEAAVQSQNPPHSVSTWNEIADKWRIAIASLADIPADSPVRSLADSKLVEYRANLSTIVLRAESEKTAEELLIQAESAAKQATAEANTAQSLEDWEAALTSWEEAISKLDQIPQGTKPYADAQENLKDYDQDYQDVRQRAEKERSAARSLSQAKELAADAQRAKANAEWTLSVERWNSAIYQLNDVPEASLAHSEVEVLLAKYNGELAKAQQGQQVALSFQPVEPSFYFICGVDSLQRCTYSVQPDSLRVDVFEGFDDVIGQSITPPTERGSVTPDPDYVYEGNQLLQQITLLSTQAQLPVELYNAQGQFMARYKPELDGFVKEQGSAQPADDAV